MEGSRFLHEWIDGAIICRESSAVGFVWSIYEGCLNSFEKLLPLLSNRRSTASAVAALNEEIGRLLSWGDGFQNGELDRTLERDLELKRTTLEYLTSLGTVLADKLFTIPIFNNVRKRAELEAMVVELRSLISNARTLIDDSEDEASDLESDAGASHTGKKAALHGIASDVRFYILGLMDLLPSIERTALVPRDIPESKMDTARTSVPFQVSKPAHAYVLQLRDKFPEADTKLIERLGEANWQRRVRIREDPQEIAEVLAVETTKSIFKPVSMFHDSGVGTTLPAQSAYAPTAVSHSSFCTTATENQGGTYRVPPTPKEVLDGTPFTCEICGHFLRNIKNRVDWKVHVFADIKPYICTFSSCPDELCTFPTRRLWADHEFRKHRVDRTWHCYLCPAKLISPDIWEDHFKQEHCPTPTGEELKRLLLNCEVFNERSAELQNCPMCQKVGMKTRKEFVIHVAKHMEGIALAALPRDADSDSGSDLEGDDNSVRDSVELPPFILSEDSSKQFFERPHILEYNVPPVDLSLDEKCHIAPPFTYSQLMSQAILEAPSEVSTLREIYSYCKKSYAYFRGNDIAWKDYISDQLSANFENCAPGDQLSGIEPLWSFRANRRDAQITQAWKKEGQLSDSAPSTLSTQKARNDLQQSQSAVRVAHPRPKPQYWDHDCNGRPFSTFFSLLEKETPSSFVSTHGGRQKDAPEAGYEEVMSDTRAVQGLDDFREVPCVDYDDLSGWTDDEEIIESYLAKSRTRTAQLIPARNMSRNLGSYGLDDFLKSGTDLGDPRQIHGHPQHPISSPLPLKPISLESQQPPEFFSGSPMSPGRPQLPDPSVLSRICPSSELFGFTTDEMHVHPLPQVPLGPPSHVLSPAQSAYPSRRESKLPAIYFHHWQPPTELAALRQAQSASPSRQESKSHAIEFHHWQPPNSSLGK